MDKPEKPRELVRPRSAVVALHVEDVDLFTGAVVWLIVPCGFALPARMVDAQLRAIGAPEGRDSDAPAPYVEVAASAFDALIGPEGLDRIGGLHHRSDCAPAPELLRLG